MLALLQDVARQVIIPRFRSLACEEIMEKNPGDLVTVADREAEHLITDALIADDPGTLVVGEEATSADPTLLDRLAVAEHAFVVDPVDGTKNFVHGRPDYAVMVAELHLGQSVRGWIWQPEHKLAYVAERGGGLYRNGERVHRRAPANGARRRLLTSRRSEEGRHGDIELGPSAWCCGVDYPWLAEGKADALLYARTMPWDHAPGSLFVSETGGIVRYVDGVTYRPGRRHRARLVAAADEQIWTEVVQAVTHAKEGRRR